jgi:hypothetical protein
MTFVLPGGLGQLSAPRIFSALDPANSDAGIVLSNNNRTAAFTTTSTYGIGRGTKLQSAGKRYFEITMTSLSTTPTFVMGGGIVRSNWVPGSGFQAVGSSSGGDNWGIAGTGSSYQYASVDVNGNTGFQDTALGIVPAQNDTVMIAIDIAGGKIYAGVNNSWVAGLTPVGTTPLWAITGTPVSFYPAVTVDAYTSTNRVTINVGNAAFKYALPSGYVAWG